MSITPLHDVAIIRVYRCGVCHKAYQAESGDAHLSCGVNHAPGSCCHFAERELTQETMDALQGVLLKEE